jgi:hypothetical protein
MCQYDSIRMSMERSQIKSFCAQIVGILEGIAGPRRHRETECTYGVDFRFSNTHSTDEFDWVASG